MGQQQSQPAAIRRDATGNSTLRLSRRTRPEFRPRDVPVRKTDSSLNGPSPTGSNEPKNSMHTLCAYTDCTVKCQPDISLHNRLRDAPPHIHGNTKHTDPPRCSTGPVSVTEAASIAAHIAHRNSANRETMSSKNTKRLINDGNGPLHSIQEISRLPKHDVQLQPTTIIRDSFSSNTKVIEDCRHVPGAYPVHEEPTFNNTGRVMDVAHLGSLPQTYNPSVESEERLSQWREDARIRDQIRCIPEPQGTARALRATATLGQNQETVGLPSIGSSYTVLGSLKSDPSDTIDDPVECEKTSTQPSVSPITTIATDWYYLNQDTPNVEQEEVGFLPTCRPLSPEITTLQAMSKSLDTENKPKAKADLASHQPYDACPSSWYHPGYLFGDQPVLQRDSVQIPNLATEQLDKDHLFAWALNLKLENDEKEASAKQEANDRRLALDMQEEETIRRVEEVQPRTRECVVCCESFDPLTFPAKPPSSQCTHRPEVCPPCLQTWIATRIADNDRGSIHCPQCVTLLNHDDVRRACDHTTFAKYDKFAVLNMVNRMNNFNWCLRAGCDSGQEQNGDKLGYMKCHSCEYAQCLHHRMRWHTGETCEQYDKRTNNHQNVKSEEMINHSLLTAYLQQCPYCKVVVEKNGGCKQMTCTRCGESFIWKKARKPPKVEKPVGPRPMRTTLRVAPPTGFRARIARFLSP